MSVKKILDENWNEYDNRKIRGAKDARFFACTEPWEVDYLKDKIKKFHPRIEDSTIIAAIKSCCAIIGSPHPRDKFVICVAKRLGISEI